MPSVELLDTSTEAALVVVAPGPRDGAQQPPSLTTSLAGLEPAAEELERRARLRLLLARQIHR